ncbi:hypothetical protein F4779DRAFT_580143 [Xylariaceae sp. FL0662B]|nr:hypothetical protein F4779DRAFT_580143 [Xylariaceae sp. FL0662B]
MKRTTGCTRSRWSGAMGSFTEGLVEKGLADTMAGDEQAVEKTMEFLRVENGK